MAGDYKQAQPKKSQENKYFALFGLRTDKMWLENESIASCHHIENKYSCHEVAVFSKK